MKAVKKAFSYLRDEQNQVNPTKEVRAKLEELGSGNLSKPVSLEKLLRRPEISYSDLKYFADNLPEIKKMYKNKLKSRLNIKVIWQDKKLK